MKATIRLTDASNSSAVLNTLATAIQNDPSLQDQIVENGVLFEDLRTPEMERLQQELAQSGYSAFTATADSVRLLVQGDVKNLLTALFRVLRQGSDLAAVLWASGLALEGLTADQANALKKRLEADAATVTVTDTSSPQYAVTGRVRRTDGTAFGDTGYSVRAFDVVPDLDEPVPLGSHVSLPPDGTYRISYTWESTGDRNGPNLQVQLFDPQGNVVAEAGKQSAEQDATLNLEVVSCQLLHQSQGRMPTACVVPSHVPAAVIDEAAIHRLADIKILQDRLKLGIEELVSLFHLVPAPAEGATHPSRMRRHVLGRLERQLTLSHGVPGRVSCRRCRSETVGRVPDRSFCAYQQRVCSDKNHPFE